MRHIKSQRGAVAVTVILLALVMVGLIGLSVDFGRFFILKSEMQNAADSCALSAARELDGTSDSLERAVKAGLTAGNLNHINFQTETAGFVETDIKFGPSLNGTDWLDKDTAILATVKYVRCERQEANLQPWLMSALGGALAENRTVGVIATASLVPAQSPCALPVRITVSSDTVAATQANNYGLAIGQWLPSLFETKAANNNSDSTDNPSNYTPGHFGWGGFNGENSASGVEDQLKNSSCNIDQSQPLGTPGTKQSLAEVWNWRFGIYKNQTVSDYPPDYSGVAYLPRSWSVNGNGIDDNWDNSGCTDPSSATPANYYNYTTADDQLAYNSSSNATENYLSKRASNTPFQQTGSVTNYETKITGKNTSCTGTSKNFFAYSNGNAGATNASIFSGNPTFATLSDHQTYGTNRRLVLAPIVRQGSNTITDFACIFLLHPIPTTGGKETVYLEFVGLGSAANSPCATIGTAGGNGTGPKVSALVQ